MSDPIPAVDEVPVYGTFVALDRTPIQGQIRFTVSLRLNDVTDHVVIPVGGQRTVTLDVDGAFSTTLPAVDDPDISPNSYSIVVEEKFTGPSGIKGATYNIQPTLDMMPGGLDLSTVTVPTGSVTPPSTVYRSVPGGFAGLDADGDVVDASGTKILGGSGGGDDTVDTLGGTGANGKLLMKGSTASVNLGNLNFSTYMKGIVTQVDNAALQAFIGYAGPAYQAFINTFLLSATLSDAQTNLGISTFIKGLLDDANQAAALSTLGAAAVSHTHAESEITNLVTDLAAKASVSSVTALTTTVGTKADTSALTTYIPASTKGAINGVAGLDSSANLTLATAVAGYIHTVDCPGDVQPLRSSITTRTDIFLRYRKLTAISTSAGYAITGDYWEPL